MVFRLPPEVFRLPEIHSPEASAAVEGKVDFAVLFCKRSSILQTYQYYVEMEDL